MDSFCGYCQVDEIYIDFFKAFNRVDHIKCISKLDTLDIGDSLLS